LQFTARNIEGLPQFSYNKQRLGKLIFPELTICSGVKAGPIMSMGIDRPNEKNLKLFRVAKSQKKI